MFNGKTKRIVRSKKEKTQHTQKQDHGQVYIDLGRPDERDGRVLWSADEPHQDPHVVINRLAAKPADGISKEDIQ